jgi:phosphate-selective porin OprO/OprP
VGIDSFGPSGLACCVDRKLAIQLVTASILAVLACALPTAGVRAAEASGTQVPPSPTNGSETAIAPKSLKQQVRVTVETNAPPIQAGTNVAKPKEKSFQWNISWDGWNGVHADLSQRTSINDPLSQVGLPMLFGPRDKNQVTNTDRIFHLEEAKMSAKIGAKLQLDGAAYANGSQFKDFDNGFELRRFRLYARGACLLLLPVSYEIEIGYIPNQFYLENSYLAFRDLHWLGELKIGQYQAPMSLEAVTSSRDVTWMETAAPVESLAPGINAGLEVGRPVFDQRATWKLGFFTAGAGSQDVGEATKNYGRAISRITGLPIYKPNPEHPDSTTLLHLGLSANILYSGNFVRYRSRPESHLAPFVVDTGDIEADGALVTGAEAAWVNGPFSVQGEYLHSWVQQKNGQVPGFEGLYASVSWFLTGESRPYDRQNGCFTRVVPHKNFDWGKGGWGAFEIAGRYSIVDLNSADVHGGRLSMLMSGVNWYLHSHVKWRFEYGFGHVSKRQPEGNLNIFQTRVEIDF